MDLAVLLLQPQPVKASSPMHETVFVSKVHWMLDPLTNHRRPIIQKHKIATRPWALGHWERVGPLAPKLFTAAWWFWWLDVFQLAVEIVVEFNTELLVHLKGLHWSNRLVFQARLEPLQPLVNHLGRLQVSLYPENAKQKGKFRLQQSVTKEVAAWYVEPVNYYFTKIKSEKFLPDGSSISPVCHRHCITGSFAGLKILQELELWDILHLKRHLLLCDLAEEASCWSILRPIIGP